MPVIVARDLRKTFKDLVAVDNISFSIEEGEMFGFLGPNGAGKTTTMRMIQCISPVTSGSLEIFGMDVSDHQREIKSLMGVVPQENNLDMDFTVYENLMVYSRYFDIPKEEAEERVEELLDFVQLTDKKDTMTESLSGGMKRRLILARALVNRPRLLILDEPTVGLDPQARHLIWDRLRLLQKNGVTVVLTSHLMRLKNYVTDWLSWITVISWWKAAPQMLLKNMWDPVLWRLRTIHNCWNASMKEKPLMRLSATSYIYTQMIQSRSQTT